MVKLSKGGAYLINGTEIIEDSQRARTGMETAVAQVCGGFLVGLADFVLEITAFEVFVKAFIHFH